MRDPIPFICNESPIIPSARRQGGCGFTNGSTTVGTCAAGTGNGCLGTYASNGAIAYYNQLFTLGTAWQSGFTLSMWNGGGSGAAVCQSGTLLYCADDGGAVPGPIRLAPCGNSSRQLWAQSCVPVTAQPSPPPTPPPSPPSPQPPSPPPLCASGSFGLASCTACASPAPGQYVVAPCAAYSNTVRLKPQKFCGIPLHHSQSRGLRCSHSGAPRRRVAA